MRTASDPTRHSLPRLRRTAATLAVAALALAAHACTDRQIVAVDIGTVTVTPDLASILVGEQLPFSAGVRDVAGRNLPAAEVTWVSLDPGVVTIDTDGRAQGVSPGATRVEAMYRGVTGSAEVTVLPAPDIRLRRDTLVLGPADTVAIFGAVSAQSPPAEVLLVRSGGAPLTGLGVTVDFDPAGPAGWLTAVLADDESPTTLSLVTQTATLGVGVYHATVTVSSPDDRDGPFVLPVVLSLTGLSIVESDGSTGVAEGGTTDTFEVVLLAEPDADVVLTVASGDTGEATVSPDRLTFTPGDWNVPQTVTVQGVDEVVADGDQVVQVSVTVVDEESDDAYDPIPPATVDVTVADDDDPAFTVTESGGVTSVTEAGSTDGFTVVLDVQPITPVIFDVASGDTTEARVSPTRLTFTPADWSLPQAVTVTGVDDRLIDGDVVSEISISIDPAPSADAFDALPPQTVSVHTSDDDVAGYTIVESGGSTQVAESGSTDDFTVVLGSEPVGNVVLRVTSGDSGEVMVSPGTLTFTGLNWDAPQIVTVTGVDDPDIDGSVGSTITVAVDAGATTEVAYDVLPPQQVVVTTTDDDQPGFAVVEGGGGTVVTEAGSTDDFTVVLQARPDLDVVITVTSGAPTEAVASPASLTFTPADWDVPQTVTVTGVDELIDDGDQVTAITLHVDDAASDDAFDAVPDRIVSVTTIDNDVAGFTTAHTGGGTLVSESGTTDVFTVVLDTEPVSNVVLSVVSARPEEATVAPTSLTFTPANWSTPQSVVVTGVDDIVDDGDQFTAITVSVVAASSDDAFDGVLPRVVTVTTTDNDEAAGFTVTAIGGTIVTEQGGTDNFSVVLTAEPMSPVTLNVTGSDPGEATVAPATLVFTGANWSVAQTVTVTGADDDLIDGTQASVVTVSVDDAASDDAFDPLPDQTLPVTTLDDDVAGFVVTESGGTTVVNEGGTTDSVTVVLSARPDVDVVVTVASANTDEATVAPTTITFTPAAWSTPQTVTVTGVQEPAGQEVIDGDQPTEVTFAIDAGSDPNFAGLAAQVVTVTTTDDDAPGVTVTASGGTTVVDESGTTDDFTVVLASGPTSDVVLSVSSSDPVEATVAPLTLTFTPMDWNVAQTVTVTGVDDDATDGDRVSTVTVSVVDASSDDAYDPVPDQTISVTTTDDDGAGFTIVESGGGTFVDEGGSTDDFTVVLDARPATNVTLTISSADIGEATVSPAALTFTNANWSTPQTVTVTGHDDALIDGNQITTVTLAVDPVTSDDAYDAVPDRTVSVTTADDDVAGFFVTETAGGTLVTEAGSTDAFSVVLATQPITDVVFTVTSGDPGEATVAPTTLTFTGATWNVPQIVTVTGVDDALIDGSRLTVVTISVVDAASDDAYDAVADRTVSVTTTDDDLAGFTVTQSSGSTTVTEAGGTDDLAVVLLSEPASNVVLTVTSADLGEVTVAPATLTFTPASWNVPQTVTATGTDDLVDDGDQATVVTIAVDAAASDDAFDAAPSRTVTVTTTDDDAAGLLVAETGGGTLVTEAGSTDDFTVALTSQPLSNVVIHVTSGDLGEATVAPATLTFTPANYATPQTVTVTGVDDLEDDGSRFTPVTLSIDDALSDAAYDLVPNRIVTVTTTDDDRPAGFTITVIGATSVSEAGSTDEFTVVLDAQPAGNVVLTVTSADAGEVTAAPATLTFTAANWSTPQTVTVTGADDDVIDGTQLTLVTVAVDAAASDNAYDAVPSQAVTVTTTDDDVAGFTVVESGGTTVVSESGTTDDFTVVLDAEPGTNVVLQVTSSDPGEATAAPATLTFTPANWNVAQTVTVTGVDDDLTDGTGVSSLTISVDAAASDDAFDGVPSDAVTVTTTDDDQNGFSLAESGGTTVVDESGTTDDFTVVLDAQPASDVVLTVISADPGEAEVSPTTLTFTPATWNVAQTVTVTGVDDDENDGPQPTIVTVSVNDALSDDGYDPVPDATVTVTTTDDDEAGFTIVETGGTTAVTELGSTDDFTVVLDAQPTNPVVLEVSSADTGEAAVSPATLTFTSVNWSAPQTVTVTGVDDDVIDGTRTTLVTVSVDPVLSDAAYDPLPDQTVTVTTADDDVAGFSVAESGGGTLVTEAGSTDDFTVVLDVEPASNVVLVVASQDETEAVASPATLTFTPANWSTSQTVTVTGVDDDIVDGSRLAAVTVSVDDALSDDDFDALADESVSVTITDDDVAGFTVTESGGSSSVTEAGGTDTFGVVLSAQPSSDVVLTVTSADLGEVLASPGTLTFTAANWSTPQLVTLTGVDDAIDDGDQAVNVVVSVADASSDDDFDPLPDRTIAVTVTDDDEAGFTIVETLGSTIVSEVGGTDIFTVVLNTQPVTNVVLTVTSADLTEVTVSPVSLTFTPANWNAAQAVTVTGVDDLVNDGNQVTEVSVSVNDGPSDDAFDALPDGIVDVTTTDDDLAGFTISQSGGGTVVNESGSTDDFTVVLTAQPQSDVVLRVTSGDTGEATVAPATLTFTSANWTTPQTVTVTGVDDAFDDNDQFTLVSVSVDDALSDDAFDPLADQSVSVTTVDDDGAGIAIVESGGSTVVTEASGAGNSDGFTVALTSQPTLDVVLTVSSADTGEATVAPATLTFTSANWSTPQGVTVTGVDDAIDDGDRFTAVTISVDDAASDDSYDAVTDRVVTVTTSDDDTAGLTVVESGGTTTVTEAAGAGHTDDFTVVLDSEPTSDVVLTVVSGDPGEATVAPASLTFTPLNWSTPQTVVVTGVDETVDDGDQVSTVTVSVDDPSSDDAYDGVPDATVSVTTTDDDSAGFTLTESGGGTSVTESGTTDSFTIVLDAQPAASVVFTVSTADAGEVTAAPAVLTFGSADWSTPQTVTVTGVDDDVDDGDQSTLVTVSVNDAASDDAFDALPDQSVSVTTVDDETAGIAVVESGGSTTVTEAAGLGRTDGFTVALESAPLFEVVLTVTSSDTGEGTVAPATLTFSPTNWAVPQAVTVTGVDDALIDGDVGFTVTLAVDDAASDDAYDPLADVPVSVTTLDDDVAGFTIAETGGTSVSEAGTTDAFTVVLDAEPATSVVLSVTSGDTGEATVAPATVTFTPAGWDTPQSVTVTGVDDAIADGPRVTTVTVAVVDAFSDDAWDPLPDQTVEVTTIDDDGAGFTVAQSGGSTIVGEAGTTDDFTVVLTSEPVSDVVILVTSGDTSEATVAPATLTFTPANWSTEQTVTVTGVDDPLADGTRLTTVTVAVDDPASDPAYGSVADQTVAVQTTDDDVAGFSITQSGGGTLVTEDGSTDDFTVVLTAQPLSNVVLTVTSGDVGEATVSPATLTFTPANWSTAQTVTVTGVNDFLIDSFQFTLVTVEVDDAASDDAFDPLAGQSVSVTTTDDDVASFSVTESGGATAVDESGTTDDFSVVLGAQPVSSVVLSVSISDASEATLSTATLTFTGADWNVPQAVTVTGVDDFIIDGTQVSTVTVTVLDAFSDDDWDPLPDQTVTVSTANDDAAGVTLTESGGGTSVTEAGSSDGFDVVLTAEPLTDVVLSVTSDDEGEATVAPATLTFTPADWSTPQTVTVTGVDDFFDDGDQAASVIVSVVDASSDDDWDPLADGTVTSTTVDDDTAGVTVTQSSGATSVTEAAGAGDTDDFDVMLDAQPVTDVVLTVTSGDTGEATVAPATLTFTTANWSTPQTVTVTGVDDVLVDGDATTTVTVAVDDGASDDAFDAVADETVSVTTVDDDVPSFSITESSGATSVTEAAGAGNTDDFDVVLDAQPLSDVVLTVVSGDTGEATVAPATLTFTTANWSTPQTVTVTGVADPPLVDGNATTTVTVAVDDASSDDAWDALADQTLSVTTTDSDVAGFTVTESSGATSVTEAAGAGNTDDFDVVLDAQPLSDVVLTVVSGDTGEATVAPATLTFTTANWSTPQTVTVTGVADPPLVDGDATTTVTLAVDDATSDDLWDALADETVSVTTVDADVAGFTVTESGGSTTVTESGTTDGFDVVLDAQPLTNVVLAVTSGDTGEATVAPATLTFTTANWATPQTVTVTGVADAPLADGDATTTVTVAVDDATSDDLWDPLGDQTVSVTTLDGDVAGFTVTESSGATSVTEAAGAGNTDDFDVVLDAQPVSDVVLTVTSGDTGEATVAPATLTFTTVNWATPQTVTVTGVDDDIDDGDPTTTVTVAVDDAMSHDVWDALADETVSVTTVDDDTAGFTITESSGATSVTEGAGAGNTDDFTVVLDSEPISDVVLTVTSGDTGEATVSPATLTFTSANWSTPQAVTVTGVDDPLIDGTQNTTITISVDDAASDDTYDPLADETVTAATTSDDVAGFTIVESGGSTSVTEAPGVGRNDEFTVVLDAQPISDVVISVTSGDTGEATVDVIEVKFTPLDWNVPQEVRVTGVDDSVPDGDQVILVTLSVVDLDSDDDFDPLPDVTVSVTVVDAGQ